MTDVTSPSTVAREALKNLLLTEFADEGFPVLDDRLHGSIGLDGTRIATSPTRERATNRNGLILMAQLFVQFYGQWDPEIDPNQIVDPAKIENYAERFRRALRTADPDQPNVWFFNLNEINYPPDPTGNMTRFEAAVDVFGNNSSIMETTG